MYKVLFSNGTASYERSLAEAKRMVYETVKNSAHPDDFGKVYALDFEGYENGIEYEVFKRNGKIDMSSEAILETLGIELKPVTIEEEERIRESLKNEAPIRKVFRVKDPAAEENFNRHCKKENITDRRRIDRSPCGSRKNWWSIITNTVGHGYTTVYKEAK